MNSHVNLAVANWVKSSYSQGNGGDCVEFSRTFAHTHGIVPVRDSKTPQHPALILPTSVWSSFVSAVREGEFRR